MLKGDPDDGTGHKLVEGEAYIEWIATHPDHTGKGLGSRLLKWAEEYARKNARAQFLSLGVMKANEGARKLYERKGFVVTKDPHINDECDECLQGTFVVLNSPLHGKTTPD